MTIFDVHTRYGGLKVSEFNQETQFVKENLQMQGGNGLFIQKILFFAVDFILFKVQFYQGLNALQVQFIHPQMQHSIYNTHIV